MLKCSNFLQKWNPEALFESNAPSSISSLCWVGDKQKKKKKKTVLPISVKNKATTYSFIRKLMR